MDNFKPEFKDDPSSYFDASQPTIQWGAFADSTFNAPEVKETAQSLVDTAYIRGYIAARKNALTADYPAKAVEEACKAVIQKELSEGKEGQVYNYIKKNGEKDESKTFTISQELLSKPTLTVYRSLAPQDCAKLVKGYYKVNFKEAKAEYLVVEIPAATNLAYLKNTDQTALTTASSTTNHDGSVMIIKEKKLLETMLSTQTKLLYILQASVSDMNGDISAVSAAYLKSLAVGTLVPQCKISRTDASKAILSPIYTRLEVTSGAYSKVPAIGYLGVPYGVNRSFVQDAPPADLKEITNKDKVKEFAIPPDISSLGVTKPLIKPEAGQPSMNETECIPYSVYQTQYMAMGVTAEMLDNIRKRSSEKSSGMTQADMDKIYLESIANWNTVNTKK